MSWWREGVLYQIYPRSFADSDGDGIGDLRGVISRLDHLEWLGIDGIWLNPTMPSPNDDWGYDVADYKGVHPDLGKPDGSPPNNWVSNFGGSAWTQVDGRFYLHNFLPTQPDLDWWNEDVRDAFDAILRFWFGRGIAGFRIDVAHGIVKDRQLRDNPEATAEDNVHFQRIGQRPVFS